MKILNNYEKKRELMAMLIELSLDCHEMEKQAIEEKDMVKQGLSYHLDNESYKLLSMLEKMELL